VLGQASVLRWFTQFVVFCGCTRGLTFGRRLAAGVVEFSRSSCIGPSSDGSSSLKSSLESLKSLQSRLPLNMGDTNIVGVVCGSRRRHIC